MVATTPDPDLTAADVAWDLTPLVDNGDPRSGVDELLDRARAIAEDLQTYRGRVGELDASELADVMGRMADLGDLVGRAGSFAGLDFSTDMADPARGALMQRVEERSTAIETSLVFFELEWAQVDDTKAEDLLADDGLAFCRHYLRSMRRYRGHLLSEPEEKVLSEKAVTGRNAWSRLFSELTGDIKCRLHEHAGVREVSLEEGLSLLADPDREVRRSAAAAVTEGLEPGLRTRAYLYNTLLADKSTDDRLRNYPSWIASRNLANEASDESVQALVDAVVARYDIPQRWYRLKAELLGIERLSDYDRMASVAQSDAPMGWDEASTLVLDAYASFSAELAADAERFFEEPWIDAPVRPAKRPGAFCAYTVPSAHPYLLLNWTGRRRDALTLAHELGHGLHAYLARGQGIFHQSTPLTLAETASVFGETVTFGRLLDATADADDRLALLAEALDGSIATVFRQVAMNRFEDAVHTERRGVGELSVDRFGELWIATQNDMVGDSVDLSDGYTTWWSYIPHFIGTPGYVYAYAYGQLLALSVYRRYEEQGADFVASYLDLLRAGGSMPPEELGKIVGCDLADPGFWDGGLAIVESQLTAAEEAAVAAGRTQP